MGLERLQRFRAIMAREELDGFLVTSNENRRYLSGFSGSSGVLLITFSEALLLTDFRYLEQAEEESKEYGFTVFEHEAIIWKTVAAQMKKLVLARKSTHLRCGFEADSLVEKDYRYLQTAGSGVELTPTEGLLTEMRSVKSAEEIALIKKAVAITDQAWQEVRPQIEAGFKEGEVAALFEYAQRRLGASGASFQTIVASGPRSALPHGVAGERVLKEGDLVVIDGGAVYNGYCSDFTRTVVVGAGLPGEEEQRIYDLVLTAQKAALSGLKPGMTGKEGDALGRKIIEESGYGDNFRHGLGHSLGLSVHEEPRLSPNAETVLTPGMVLTVEPGIYIPGWGGVRIEDVVVITENGCVDLTNSPKELSSSASASACEG